MQARCGTPRVFMPCTWHMWGWCWASLSTLYIFIPGRRASPSHNRWPCSADPCVACTIDAQSARCWVSCGGRASALMVCCGLSGLIMHHTVCLTLASSINTTSVVCNRRGVSRRTGCNCVDSAAAEAGVPWPQHYFALCCFNIHKAAMWLLEVWVFWVVDSLHWP